MEFLEEIEQLAELLKKSKTAIEKNAVLDRSQPVVRFFQSSHPLHQWMDSLSIEQMVAMKQLIAIGQAPLDAEISQEKFEHLLSHLVSVDAFYRELGGIVGYQCHVLRLLQTEKKERLEAEYHSPHFIDISQETKTVEEAILSGIEAMPFLCEMYPVGGAADRLHLVDQNTGQELPAAKLEFARMTLLERMIRDLEAREYLYFQHTQKTLTTPIALMTSYEKDNHHHILQILEDRKWFGRPKDRFKLFVQPLVPVVDQEGAWVWKAPWKLSLKPGGHGAIWKLAKDQGVFQWFRSLGAQIALIRQINNPLAGLDYGLLAFAGIGFAQKKSFGFASCPRLCLSAEGMNVLIERKSEDGYSYAVSNIEYTDFEKFGIEDRPLVPHEPYSRFTSNTNILFIDLNSIETAIEKCPFPGLIINMKKKNDQAATGRLESAMQNIADVFIEETKERLKKHSHQLQKTFITYNYRHKTISTAKKVFVDGSSLSETPENCFFDLMRSYRELLRDFCNFSLPREVELKNMLAGHPPFVFLFHPSLGPLYRTIAKKIRGGELADGSEMILDLVDVDIENLTVDGSLHVQAKNPLGTSRFSVAVPRCVLKNIKIINRGVDWLHSRPYWKGQYQRFESLEIVLNDRSEFIAQDVCFEKGLRFEVPEGERMIVSQKGTSLQIQRERAG